MGVAGVALVVSAVVLMGHLAERTKGKVGWTWSVVFRVVPVRQFCIHDRTELDHSSIYVRRTAQRGSIPPACNELQRTATAMSLDFKRPLSHSERALL